MKEFTPESCSEKVHTVMLYNCSIIITAGFRGFKATEWHLKYWKDSKIILAVVQFIMWQKKTKHESCYNIISSYALMDFSQFPPLKEVEFHIVLLCIYGM